MKSHLTSSPNQWFWENRNKIGYQSIEVNKGMLKKVIFRPTRQQQDSWSISNHDHHIGEIIQVWNMQKTQVLYDCVIPPVMFIKLPIERLLNFFFGSWVEIQKITVPGKGLAPFKIEKVNFQEQAVSLLACSKNRLKTVLIIALQLYIGNRRWKAMKLQPSIVEKHHLHINHQININNIFCPQWLTSELRGRFTYTEYTQRTLRVHTEYTQSTYQTQPADMSLSQDQCALRACRGVLTVRVYLVCALKHLVREISYVLQVSSGSVVSQYSLGVIDSTIRYNIHRVSQCLITQNPTLCHKVYIDRYIYT